MPAIAQEVLRTARGDGPGDFFGQSVAGGLDLSGDGKPDLVVGAIEPHPIAPGPGFVRAIDGRTGAVLWTTPGLAQLEHFGTAVALVPDIDGDGLAEVLAGAPRANASTGVARLLRGADGAVLAAFPGATANDLMGAAVGTAGDIDGDGVHDLGLGAPGAGAGAGRLLVISGASGATLLDRPGVAAGDRFGAAFVPLGDFDGDGTDDLLVGAPGMDLGGVDTGAVLAISGATGAILASWTGGVPASSFGGALAVLGDVTGDGAPEIVVGAWSDPGFTPGLQPGSVNVISLPAGTLLYRRIGVTADDFMGRTLAALGDFDGDGWPDWAASSRHDPDNEHPGVVFVHSGLTGEILRVLYGDRDQDGLATSIARAGDIDGDGLADVLAGAPEPYHGTPGTGYVRVWRGGPGHILWVGRSCWTPPAPRLGLDVIVQPAPFAPARLRVRNGTPNGLAVAVIGRRQHVYSSFSPCAPIAADVVLRLPIPLDAGGQGERMLSLPLQPVVQPQLWLQAFSRAPSGGLAATWAWHVLL